MKVMQVLYSGLGGHGSVVKSLIEADKKNEWEHCLLFYGIEDMLPAYRSFCENRNIPYAFIKKRKGAFRSSGAAVRKAMRKFDPDVIILHSPGLIIPAWLYTRGKRKKLIEVEHTPHHAKSFGEKAGTFFSFLLAQKIVCLTPAYKQELKKRFKILPVEKKAVVIPNGIDLDKFCPVAKANTGELHIGMIGRFSQQKNQEMIIDAAQKMGLSGEVNAKIHFHFAGTGETMEYLVEKMSQNNIGKYVHFHGLLDEKGIIDFLSELDVYVHASYSETMCTSVMQAMACGLPVLGSNISGINDIVEVGKNALLFENEDIDNLIKYILDLIMHDDKRKVMGDNARYYALIHFSADNTFKNYSLVVNQYDKFSDKKYLEI